VLGVDPSKPDEMQAKEVLSYSIAGFGQNIICQLVTTFFMFYLTQVVVTEDSSIMYLAYMFLFARLFDAFNDPIMGTIVDITKSKYGKMRPYLKYSPIPIAIFTVLLFTSIPGISESGKLAYSTVIYLCWGIAYTSVDVPYWGLASSMTSDTDKRNTMLTVARLFCTIGSGLVSVVIPIITGTFDENTTRETMQIAYLLIAIVSVVLAVPPFFIGFKNTKERFYDDENKTSLGHNVKLLFKNYPILLMIAIGVVGSLRTIYMTTALYYAQVNLGNTALASIMFLLVVPGGLAATLMTPYLSKKFGKRNVFLVSHLIGGVLLVLLYFIGLPSDGTSTAAQIAFYIIIILAGIPSGFSNIMTYSMIGDSIDYLEDKTGERAEGICFSMQTFISKIGMALTAFVTLLVLGASGYAVVASGASIVDDAGNVIPEIANTLATVKKNIWMVTTLACGLSMAACAIPLFFYNFTEKKQADAVARVAARKAGLTVAPNATKEEVEAMMADANPVEVALEKAEENDIVTAITEDEKAVEVALDTKADTVEETKEDSNESKD
jgi:sugar (glycoside-pentoside-hexuronide) transporter